MYFDQRVQAVQDAAQRLCLISAEGDPSALPAECRQLLREPADLDMIAAHRRGGLGRAHDLADDRVERALFRLGVRNQVVRKEVVDHVDLLPEHADRRVADRIGRRAQQLDLWQQLLVLIAQGLGEGCHRFSPSN